MTRQELEAIRQDNAAIVKRDCAKHGLYGNVVYYEPSPILNSSKNRMYIVAGMEPKLGEDPFPKCLRPDEMLQAIRRNEKLFYPHAWVFDLLETKDEIVARQSLAEYCQKATFVGLLYAEYGLPAPKVLRESEVHQLLAFRSRLDNPDVSAAMKQKIRKDLDRFFRREKTRNRFRQNWLNYFRSEKFPDDKGPLAKIRGFLARNRCEVSLEQLMDCNTNVSKLEMQEYEFRIFQKLIQDRYPFVTYAAGDKDIVDHGLTNATRRDDNPFGKAVSAEEYAVIRKERFAEEGWDCVANLKPAYWEFRDIYYKDCDAPFIASLYQHITLQYAKCDSLGELKSRSPLKLQKVPANDFMNFVSLAKANRMRFYIDTLGEYETPTLDSVNVLYNDYQQHKMDYILDRMIQDKVNFAPVLNTPSRPTLNSLISDTQEKSRLSMPRATQKDFPFEK